MTESPETESGTECKLLELIPGVMARTAGICFFFFFLFRHVVLGRFCLLRGGQNPLLSEWLDDVMPCVTSYRHILFLVLNNGDITLIAHVDCQI
jgi:hypothetical protein